MLRGNSMCGGCDVVERIIWCGLEQWRRGEGVWRVGVWSVQVVITQRGVHPWRLKIVSNATSTVSPFISLCIFNVSTPLALSCGISPSSSSYGDLLCRPVYA